MAPTAIGARQRGLPDVVIVGGGFGGLSAAQSLARAPVRVTLIDRSNHHLFQPLLYQVATAGLSPADIAAPIRNVLRRQANTRVLMAEVTGVDAERRRVLLGDREAPYDYLVLATGASHAYFGHDEWARYAPGLKSIPDALRIRRTILTAFETAEVETNPALRRALLTFVVVGGGPTGVEMAGAIAELARTALRREFRTFDPSTSRIVLAEGGPRLLPAFPEHLADQARRALERMGVEVRLGHAVDAADGSGVHIDGEFIDARTVIWAAGVAGSPAARWLGVPADRAGRVLVSADLLAPGLPDVYVIGDTAALEQDGRLLPGIAAVAKQQGEYVARAIAARARGARSPGPFRYRHRGSLATVGRSFAVADLGAVQMSGRLAWVAWLFIHIYFLIGFQNRLRVLIQWAWAYFAFGKSARLIVPGEEVPAVDAVHAPTVR